MTTLLVGLGNPGPDYVGTRHNVGFEVLDHLARHEGLLFRPAKALEGYTGPRTFQWTRSFDPSALLVKPETFMNRSGDVVAPLAEWLEVAPEDIVVVYDDLDLDVGKLRIRPHGGAGGQKGMKSIIERLGSNRFPRLRVGIGSPGTDAARHVLGRFTEKERVEIDISVAEAAEALLDLVTRRDLQSTMSRFHSRWNPGD